MKIIVDSAVRHRRIIYQFTALGIWVFLGGMEAHEE
jgi:hypothetical protein